MNKRFVLIVCTERGRVFQQRLLFFNICLGFFFLYVFCIEHLTRLWDEGNDEDTNGRQFQDQGQEQIDGAFV